MRKTFLYLLCLIATACKCSGVPAPTPNAPTAQPQPTIPLTDAGSCEIACKDAQTRCSHPASVSQCVLDCQRAAPELENLSVQCIALLSTCNRVCQDS